MNWTSEQEDELRGHHTSGLSASQSAAIIGVTRNAVIGKWARLGLPKRRAVPPPSLRPAFPTHGGLILPKIKAAQRRNKERERAAPELMPDSKLSSADIPRQQRRTFFDLGERHCRWPCGEPGAPDFFFCGGIRKDPEVLIGRGGVPYCATHCQAAYIPAPRRRTPYVYRGPQI